MLSAGLAYTEPTFNSCTKYVGSPGIIHNRMPDCHPFSLAWMHIYDLTIECSFDSQAIGAIDVLALFIDILSIYSYTTRHLQTSGQLVQEWNHCTVQRNSPSDMSQTPYKMVRRILWKKLYSSPSKACYLLTRMLLVAYLANTKWCKTCFKMTETLAHGYSYENSQRELSNEYQQVLDCFKQSVCSCALDESSLSIARVRSHSVSKK